MVVFVLTLQYQPINDSSDQKQKTKKSPKKPKQTQWEKQPQPAFWMATSQPLPACKFSNSFVTLRGGLSPLIS